MRSIIASNPIEGLKIANTKYSKTRYLASKNFVLVELDRGKEFIFVYLRAYEKNKTLITAHLPELEYLENLRAYNKPGLLKFLSRSKSISELYKAAATISDKPFISKVHDFADGEDVKVWCIQKIVDLELTPKIINQDFREYKILEKGINEIVGIALEFLKTQKEHLLDFNSAYWLKNINPLMVKSIINHCEQEGFWGTLVKKVDEITDPTLKEFIIKHKVVLKCQNAYYAIGDSINDRDRNQDAKVFIMAEIFDDSIKETDYMFCVDLEYNYNQWKPKANLGELIEGVSIMLNHVNTKAWVKIDDAAYKFMPKASEIWYYSNPYHEGTILSRFMQAGDRADYDMEDPTILVKEPEYLVCNSYGGVNCNDPWDDLNSFNYVSLILGSALTVASEFYRYYPIWKRKSILEIAKNPIKILLNPYKVLFKKLLGMN